MWQNKFGFGNEWFTIFCKPPSPCIKQKQNLFWWCNRKKRRWISQLPCWQQIMRTCLRVVKTLEAFLFFFAQHTLLIRGCTHTQSQETHSCWPIKGFNLRCCTQCGQLPELITTVWNINMRGWRIWLEYLTKSELCSHKLYFYTPFKIILVLKLYSLFKTYIVSVF